MDITLRPMLKLLARPMVADVLRVLRGQRLWQL